MTVFNFTVRATDSIGAFSDRNFSINVRNTVVERFVASTAEGHLLTSVDGDTWTYRINLLTAGSAGYPYGNVINGNGFWLVTKTISTYLYSEDAITWTEHTLPENTFFLPMAGLKSEFAYGDGKIAVVCSNTNSITSGNTTSIYFLTTTDGKTWTRKEVLSLTPNNRFGTPVFGNGRWIIPTATTGLAIGYTSVDNGDTWTTITSTANDAAAFRYKIFFFNGLWILQQRSSAFTFYQISNDGLIWSPVPTPLPTATNAGFVFEQILYGNGLLVGYPTPVSGGGTTVNAFQTNIYTSTNGNTWNVVPVATNTMVVNGSFTATSYSFGATTATTYGHISGVYHNGKFIFGSQWANTVTSGGLMISTNGTDWTRANITLYSNNANTNVSILGLAALRQ